MSSNNNYLRNNELKSELICWNKKSFRAHELNQTHVVDYI
jgi:hypothetical protein